MLLSSRPFLHQRWRFPLHHVPNTTIASQLRQWRLPPKRRLKLLRTHLFTATRRSTLPPPSRPPPSMSSLHSAHPAHPPPRIRLPTKLALLVKRQAPPALAPIPAVQTHPPASPMAAPLSPATIALPPPRKARGGVPPRSNTASKDSPIPSRTPTALPHPTPSKR